ncbi:hypothetical protein H9L15_08930 [Sphingomonas daechungensis]|uniref:Uncharacterized protein n=1 Tax=Sphingomonas daechungensis TaxID=1176646 RepID=A0ABX6SYP4_9SPHN|nr:hypothetical protein [Sphingomonas daechungensis]QNP42429.1 hypothetical protein H9L15_08930 [Sphingomonas daechungensis]
MSPLGYGDSSPEADIIGAAAPLYPNMLSALRAALRLTMSALLNLLSEIPILALAFFPLGASAAEPLGREPATDGSDVFADLLFLWPNVRVARRYGLNRLRRRVRGGLRLAKTGRRKQSDTEHERWKQTLRHCQTPIRDQDPNYRRKEAKQTRSSVNAGVITNIVAHAIMD